MGQNLDSMVRRISKDELLYQAAVAGNVDALKALVREGARFEWFDQEGKTALIAACLSPALYDVAKALIELGANVNVYRPGWNANAGTPLHHAVNRGYEETVKLLLSHGANGLVTNDLCQTPLDLARLKGFTNVVRLIEHHISFFTGWLKEFHGPGFLGALAPQLLSKRIWVVVAPCGACKLELAIYNTLQDSQPQAVISLWKSQIDEPKFSQQDLVLRILDKSTGNRYKLGPASDGDKQQIQLFYSACSGVRQTIPSIVDPSTMSSVSTSQSIAEDAEPAMAISASMQTANEARPPLPSNSHQSSVVSASNGWKNLLSYAAYNWWGSSVAPNEPGASSNGGADQPADSSFNGRSALGPSNQQTKLNPVHDNARPTSPQMNNEITETISVNPTAPPLPDAFDEGSIHYPSIDMSSVELDPASDGDKQQIQLFYSACSGVRQTIPSIVDPSTMSSVSTSQSIAEDAEPAMAISASMQTANEARPPLPSNSHQSSVVSASNGWKNLLNYAAYNWWRSSVAPNEPGASSNGGADQPADSSFNGRSARGPSSHQTKPNPVHDNAPPTSVPQMNNKIAATVSVNPTAPPLPDGFEEGSIHYPSIDMSPVELPNATAAQGATSAKTDGNDDNRSSCCIICWEAPVQGACIPCGHMAGCMSCLSEIKSRKGDCPVCRAKINQVIRLYAV